MSHLVVFALLADECLKLVEIRVVRRVAEELTVASQIIRLALLQNRVIEAVPEPCEKLRLLDL